MAYQQEDETIVDLCEQLLGSEVQEIAVDADDEIVYIYTSNGMIRIEGYDIRMYVETDRFND